jgi:hydroxymethylglutaryl-CoA synthase
MTGIINYGFYFPKFRIKSEEIARTWQKDPLQYKKSLKLEEKAVASIDEDTATMAIESSSLILRQRPDLRTKIKYVYLGTETPVYAVNPTSTIIADFLDLSEEILSLDNQFACRAATGALVTSYQIAKANANNYSLVIASDKSNSKPDDALEFSAGSGSTAWLIGSKDVALEIIDSFSISTDTPDFWRRTKIDYPTHAGRFTGKPSYFKHITLASKRILEKNNLTPKDFQKAVFHMPNGKFPRQVAKVLGFTFKQIQDSLIVEKLGNSYASSALMGLAAIIPTLNPGDKVFFCSYGSGAGSDALIFQATDKINQIKLDFTSKLEQKEYIDYITYRKFMQTL